MFGLCMPKGKTYLIMNDDNLETIDMIDELHPRQYIMNDEYVLNAVKHRGYQNIKAIVYNPNYKGKKEIKITMAEYYAENGQKLEGK